MNLASNFGIYNTIAQKYYGLYKEYESKVQELKKLFVGVELGVDTRTGEFTIPEHLRGPFDEISKTGELVTESAFIAVLFEHFAVEAYLNHISTYFEKDKFNMADTNTPAKFFRAYKLITGSVLP